MKQLPYVNNSKYSSMLGYMNITSLKKEKKLRKKKYVVGCVISKDFIKKKV